MALNGTNKNLSLIALIEAETGKKDVHNNVT